MIDSKAQRLNMVESQVRPSDVTDRRIVRAMLAMPRELFVPAPLVSTAYMDVDAPVEAPHDARGGRYLVAPRVLAKLIQEARIEADMRVLDVGCATGYSTALMASLARQVIGLESSPVLAAVAQKALAQLSIANARVEEGELAAGLAMHGPFDAILLNGSIAVAPTALLEQLADGGRLVAVTAEGYFGRASVWTRAGRNFECRVAFDAGAHPLPGFQAKPAFVF